MFEFRKTDVTPLLLILDRRDDAVTPLLNQVNAFGFSLDTHFKCKMQKNQWKLGHKMFILLYIKNKSDLFVCISSVAFREFP